MLSRPRSRCVGWNGALSSAMDGAWTAFAKSRTLTSFHFLVLAGGPPSEGGSAVSQGGESRKVGGHRARERRHRAAHAQDEEGAQAAARGGRVSVYFFNGGQLRRRVHATASMHVLFLLPLL